jgi:hypothetical protein
MRRARRRAVGIPIAILTLIAALLYSGCGSSGSSGGTTQANGGFTVAQLLVLRGGGHAQTGVEVLLAKNGPNSGLSPNTWVLPSGANMTDQGGIGNARATAIQRLGGMGVRVQPSDLVPYAHWIVPGFDTFFDLALAPADARPQASPPDSVDVGWFEPQRALSLHDAGALPMEYVTVKQLESLTGFSSAQDAVDASKGREVKAIRLKVVGEGPQAHAVLPQDAPQG